MRGLSHLNYRPLISRMLFPRKRIRHGTAQLSPLVFGKVDLQSLRVIYRSRYQQSNPKPKARISTPRYLIRNLTSQAIPSRPEKKSHNHFLGRPIKVRREFALLANQIRSATPFQGLRRPKHAMRRARALPQPPLSPDHPGRENRPVGQQLNRTKT
jgi:hypothetical protein